MKKIALVAIALSSSVAFAQTTLGDLNFFQKKGSIYYQGSIGESSYTFVDSLSNNKTELEGMGFKNQIGYGIADNLNVFLETTLKFQNYTRINNNEDHQDNGFTNPGVGANYRLLSGPAYFDVFGKVNMRIQDAEVGSGRKDGNAASAPDFTALVGAAFGQRIDNANEYRFTAGIAHNTEGEVKNLGTSDKSSTDSSTDLFLTADYQVRPVDTFMLDFGISGTRYGKFSQKNKATNLKTSLDAHYETNLSFKAKFLITDNLLVSFFMNGGVVYPDYSGKSGATSFDPTTIS